MLANQQVQEKPKRRRIKRHIGISRLVLPARRTIIISEQLRRQLFSLTFLMVILAIIITGLSSAINSKCFTLNNVRIEIDAAKKANTNLEIDIATISSHSNIKAAATALGMSVPTKSYFAKE